MIITTFPKLFNHQEIITVVFLLKHTQNARCQLMTAVLWEHNKTANVKTGVDYNQIKFHSHTKVHRKISDLRSHQPMCSTAVTITECFLVQTDRGLAK